MMQGRSHPSAPQSRLYDGGRLGLLITPGIAAAASFAMLPVILGAVARGWSLSDAQLGLLASTELAGLTVGTLVAVLVIRHWDRRVATLSAMLLLALANLLTMAAPSLGLLMGLRAVAGLAAGGGLAVCYANLSGAPRAERNFAIFTLAQLLIGAVGLFSLPHLVSILGWRAPYALLAGIAAIGVAAASPRLSVGDARVEVGAAMAGARPAIGGRAWAALGGVGAYYAGVAAVWTYAERLGAAAGIDAAQVATILAGSQMAAMAGAICAGVLAGRAPVPAGLLAGSLLTAGGVVALALVKGPLGFAVAVAAVNFAWNYVTAPQFAAVANIDPDGSVAGLMSTVTGIGVAAGPALGAALVGRGFVPLLSLAAILILVSLALIWPASRRRGEVRGMSTAVSESGVEVEA